MMLGLSPLYNNSPVKINIDDMWSNHTAIFGNTGSGKTYGVARLVQNLFTMPNYIPFNSVIFIFNNKIEINKEIGEKLYLGIVGDTDRFLHDYTSSKTFSLVTRLFEDTNIDFTSLYKVLYQRPISEIRFEGYIYQNLILTENGVAYIKIIDRKLKEFGVDSAAAGNMINDLKFVNEIIVWLFLTEDIKSNLIRANIRSVGPYINDVATKFDGGGHRYVY